MIVLLGGISNGIIWLLDSSFLSPLTQILDEFFGLLLLTWALSLLPIFLSLILIAFVEIQQGDKFVWWIHCIPFLLWTSLLVYWKSYFGLISLSLYYVLGAYSYWKLIYKPRLLSNQ
jgi:hypothetical protein